MKMIDEQAKFVKESQVIEKEWKEGEIKYVLFNPDYGNFVFLKKMGFDIYSLCNGSINVKKIHKKLKKNNVGKETINYFLLELIKLKIIKKVKK